MLFIFSKKNLTKFVGRNILRNMSNNRDDNIEKFAEMFKALSNPNRLRIFLRLISCCSPKVVTDISSTPEPENCACVGELGPDLGIVASTLSHHIKEPRQAGLIRMEPRGQKMECWIDTETIAALQAFFSK
jgi:ArsR family transcriptional regulator